MDGSRQCGRDQGRLSKQNAMIAAAAIVHDLTVVTRNFDRLGVPMLNPFSARTA
jgi:predicted nucleic acid-binding protein